MASNNGEPDRGTTATPQLELAANVGGNSFLLPTNDAHHKGYQSSEVTATASSTVAIMTNNRLLERLISEMTDMKNILLIDANVGTAPTSNMQRTVNTIMSVAGSNEIEKILHNIDIVDERITRLDSKKYDESYKTYGNGPAALNLSGAEKFLLAQLRETKRLLSSRLPNCA